jgi:5-methylcytosine-specific restriction endonuclease McrA
MRDYAKLAPTFWTDQHGRSWKVPQIKGRLKCGKCPGHRALREFVIWRDGSKCRRCGCTDPLKLVPDHIVSRRNGGSHHPDNLQCLCDPCNASKAARIDSKGPVQ